MRSVLNAVAEAFPAPQVSLVDELIDANETGVALEILIGILADARVPVASSVVEQILGLAREMELSPELRKRACELEAT